MSCISCILQLSFNTLALLQNTHIDTLNLCIPCHSKPHHNANRNTELDIKAILIMPNKPLSSSSSTSNILKSSMLYSSFSSNMSGEYIGMESCLDLNVNIEGNDNDRDCDGEEYKCSNERRKKRERCVTMMMKEKEFPPPITSLVRIENQLSQTPWVLKRYYTYDGCLILKKEKVRHLEYFRAHRSNGRLILQLVPLDDDDEEDYPICNAVVEEDDNVYEHHYIDGNDGDNKNDNFAVNQFGVGNENKNENSNKKDVSVIKRTFPNNESSSSIPSGGGGGNGKCLSYNDGSKIWSFSLVNFSLFQNF